MSENGLCGCAENGTAPGSRSAKSVDPRFRKSHKNPEHTWIQPGVLPCVFSDSHKRTVTVRLFAPADLGPLTEMYDAYSPKGKANGLPPISGDIRHKWIDDAVNTGTSIIATLDGRIVAHSILFPMGPPIKRAEFGIFVHQDFQNCNVGMNLACVTVCYAARAGFKSLWLIVEPRNKRAITIYKRVGFQFVGDIDIEASMIMSLERFFARK